VRLFERRTTCGFGILRYKARSAGRSPEGAQRQSQIAESRLLFFAVADSLAAALLWQARPHLPAEQSLRVRQADNVPAGKQTTVSGLEARAPTASLPTQMVQVALRKRQAGELGRCLLGPERGIEPARAEVHSLGHEGR